MNITPALCICILSSVLTVTLVKADNSITDTQSLRNEIVTELAANSSTDYSEFSFSLNNFSLKNVKIIGPDREGKYEVRIDPEGQNIGIGIRLLPADKTHPARIVIERSGIEIILTLNADGSITIQSGIAGLNGQTIWIQDGQLYIGYRPSADFVFHIPEDIDPNFLELIRKLLPGALPVNKVQTHGISLESMQVIEQTQELILLYQLAIELD